MRALLGTAAHLCKKVLIGLRTAPIGIAISSTILRVIRRGAQAICKRGSSVTPLGKDGGGAQGHRMIFSSPA